VLREFGQVRRGERDGLAIASVHDQGRRLAYGHRGEHGEGGNESDSDHPVDFSGLPEIPPTRT